MNIVFAETVYKLSKCSFICIFKPMTETISQNTPIIYLAPLQGFTDHVYRKAYSEVFEKIDKWFIPYISVKNGSILKKYLKEIQVENNRQNNVVPQVLGKNPEEILILSKVLEDMGYMEINLNLGCPYPMVTNRGMGSGLLPYPEKIKIILDEFFSKSKLKLSIKMRAGFDSPQEIDKVIPVINQFPLTEVVLHPRIATQLYKGEVLDSAFIHAMQNLKHPLVYNGDIFSSEDFMKRQLKFPEINFWMLGRGILMNPFLPMEIKNIQISDQEKSQKLQDFHNRILELYSDKMDNEGNVLNKMKQFWIYFSYVFPNQKKNLKTVKKASSIKKYSEVVKKMFWEIA